MLEKFISEEPKIERAKGGTFFNPMNLAKESVKQHDDMVSETLARIYAQQNNPGRAIQLYEKLMVNYPEKSAYFAAQIELIKK